MHGVLAARSNMTRGIDDSKRAAGERRIEIRSPPISLRSIPIREYAVEMEWRKA
jgi:hypothetical protein